ncbi:K(+)-transporting ATPase subunit F [Gordonia amarae]|uniref:K(+)-transporting ATPase subunit F n=1 Tax=Gordonia amarae TaxID=36821 RepID=A0A857KZP2_9ACTN|nr:K(+)-transporting ATPase subunit F [Gordonia amarae]MCS3879863.1 K+-transporting ATPase KdpF subunit [Gordonia amarae]QHN18277.1 K(+)-transporting ATPase subunit F [Gordonia amarae]QHN22761.1 K(+)-transporting ATPase subunit F [Gordonia amarae]QHN31665.1 K(+)-transporting ATPase subunit F [Gordonia amarae]QHN40409.1 K(+)-transporting ATPase subunit F [Gordonia amarae]
MTAAGTTNVVLVVIAVAVAVYLLAALIFPERF